MTAQDFYQLLDRTKSPDISMRFGLKTLVDKYPYFQSAVFTYLKCLYAGDDKMFRTELQRLSIFIGDKRALFYYVLNEEYEKFFRRKGERQEISLDRTNLLLDAFFESIDDKEVDNVLDESYTVDLNSNMISSDYFSYLNMLGSAENEAFNDDESEAEPMKHQNLIDDFITNAEDLKIHFDKQDDTSVSAEEKDRMIKNMSADLQDDFFFTETLANIYIKQHKYERAYEIIKRLNLNFPEKNIYFANQISFLEKLIINKKNKR